MQKTIAFLALLLSGSPLTGAQNGTDVKQQSFERVDFCDLFRDPALYVGKMVKVTATYVSDLEGAIFLDEGCKKSESMPDVVANVKFMDKTGGYDNLSKILRKEKLVPKLARVSIVTVFVDELAANRITVLAGRSRYTLEVMQVLEAEKMKTLPKVGSLN